MDDMPSIGHRELRREFEDDRHSQALLAMAFEVLQGANDRDPPETHSVQSVPAQRRELLFQKDR